jgi:hypothetical protein
MKKILALLVALIFAFGVVSLSFAAEAKPADKPAEKKDAKPADKKDTKKKDAKKDAKPADKKADKPKKKKAAEGC